MNRSAYFGPTTIGAALGLLHLGACIAFAIITTKGEWGWFPFFVLDFPASIIVASVQPANLLVAYVTIGSVWWFILGTSGAWVIRKLVTHLSTPEAV